MFRVHTSAKTSQTLLIFRTLLPGTTQGLHHQLFSTICRISILLENDSKDITMPIFHSLDYIPKTEEEDIVFTLAMVIVHIFHIVYIDNVMPERYLWLWPSLPANICKELHMLCINFPAEDYQNLLH